jgi:hypothetical protein
MERRIYGEIKSPNPGERSSSHRAKAWQTKKWVAAESLYIAAINESFATLKITHDGGSLREVT